jgi:hypothetical protein
MSASAGFGSSPIDAAPGVQPDPSRKRGPMKQVEYWRWRYRDPQTGRVCRTLFQLTVEEAARYPEAERIPGSMLLREVDDSAFADTRPRVFRPAMPK